MSRLVTSGDQSTGALSLPESITLGRTSEVETLDGVLKKENSRLWAVSLLPPTELQGVTRL